MKRTIHNPNTVNHLLYVCLIILFAATLLISNTLPRNSTGERSFISEVVLNLSYGCIASTVVAWLIDCANTRIANKQANRIYDSVYSDIKLTIGWFLDSWARLCKVCFKDENYSDIFHTWIEWYQLVKEHYNNTEPEEQEEMMKFFKDQLAQACSCVMTSVENLRSQAHLLTLNHVMDSNIEFILADYQFEFSALDMCLSRGEDDDLFWKHMDAIVMDLTNYINKWPDIEYYNKHAFRPYQFFEKYVSNDSGIKSQDAQNNTKTT